MKGSQEQAWPHAAVRKGLELLTCQRDTRRVKSRHIRCLDSLGALITLSLLIAASAQATHPRPKGSTPLRVPLVPSYNACTTPNRTHGPALAFGSCRPPG